MKYILPLLISSLLIFSGCKKGDSDDNNSTGSGNTITSDQVKVEVTIDGQTFIGTFGSPGTSLQFNSFTWEPDYDSTALNISTTYLNSSSESTIYYARIILPQAIVATSDWTTNPSQTFIDYFNGDLQIAEPNNIGLSIFMNENGYYDNSNTTGNWNISNTVESTSYPATVKCQGELNTTLTDINTNEEFQASVKFVMRFKEPL